MEVQRRGNSHMVGGDDGDSKSNQEREYLLNTYYGVYRVYECVAFILKSWFWNPDHLMRTAFLPHLFNISRLR